MQPDQEDSTDSTDVWLLGRLHDLSDDDSWRRFMHRYRPMVRNWIDSDWDLQDADAEDAVSHVLAVVARVMGEAKFAYDASKSFRGWLRTVASNEVVSIWRKTERTPGSRGGAENWALDGPAKRKPPANVGSFIDQLSSTIAQDYAALLRAMEDVKAQVDPATFQAFYLTTVEGLSGPEAAARLGIKVANVYVYKGRVTKMIRAAAGERGPGPGTG